ncbi:hypothetical protein E2C01_007758 [Portunus trituberculatus]|uniref:Uncharacterized protein n=1 Tax=Portunus trituberculatus TaxID=210409 RepID=A0A5B7D0J4_PORTR|nr:hypothetical protein [Portunus trituberculatus]
MLPCQWFGVVSEPGTRIARPFSVFGKPRASGTRRGCSAALRGVAIQRGRARTYPATALARHPTPLTAAATALHGYTP